MSSHRPTFRPWMRRIASVLSVSFVLVVAGEAFIRLVPSASDVQTLVDNQLRFSNTLAMVPHAELGAMLAPSRSDRFETQDFTYTLKTDSRGFPNTEPWPERLDVAVLGNSLVVGMGVGLEKQFTTVLGERLGGRTVLNFSVPGGATEHEIRVYRLFVAPLRPAVVVATTWPTWDVDNAAKFHHWLTDANRDPDFTQYRRMLGRRGADAPLPQWLLRQARRSRLLQTTYRRLQSLLAVDGPRQTVGFPNGETLFLSVPDHARLALGMDATDVPNIREVYFSPFEQLRTEVEADGGRLVIVLVPSKEELYGAERKPEILSGVEEIRTTLLARGLPVLDLYPAFRERGREAPPYFRTDMHHNELGNAILADEVAKWIEDQGVFANRDSATTESPRESREAARE